MNRKFLPAVTLTLLVTLNVFAQGTRDVPTRMQRSYWDHDHWQLINDESYTYNDRGLVDSITPIDSQSLNVRFYDEMGQLDGGEFYLRDPNGQWVLNTASRFNHKYENGNLTGEEEENLTDVKNNTWTKYRRHTYTYDQQGHLLTYLRESWYNGGYINDVKEVYDPAKSESIYYAWVNNAWVPFTKFTDIVWEIPNQTKKSYTSSVYDAATQSFKPTMKYSRTDGTYGSYTETTDQWDESTNAWVPNSKGNVENDSHFNLYKKKLESYNGTWYTVEDRIYIHTYNGNNLMETLHTYYSEDPAKYLPVEKFVYSGFITVSTGIHNLHSLSDVRVYPNPVRNVINISGDKKYTSAMLINLGGQTVMSIHLISGQKSIDISALPAGLYQLQLIDKDGLPAMAKIVKQ